MAAFMLIFRSKPWQDSPEQMQQHMQKWMTWFDGLTKSGVFKEDTIQMLKDISRLENISVKGLMTMPPYFNAPEKVRPFFAALRELRDQITKEAIPNISMDELSMGMTGDFEAAIQEGATMVRIGTAIFGERR